MADIEELVKRWEGGDRSVAAELIRLLLGERQPRGQLSLHPEETAFTHRFDWVFPSLKNMVEIKQNIHTGRGMMKKKQEVIDAQARIRVEIERALRGHELPLFGVNAVQRDLVWIVEEGCVEVTWRNLGEDNRKGCGNRDTVNLAAVLDDAVGRERIKRTFVGTGLIYRDDAQIQRASECRIRRGDVCV